MLPGDQPGHEGTHREHRQGRQEAVRHNQTTFVGIRAAIITGHSPTLCRVCRRAGDNLDLGLPRAGLPRCRPAGPLGEPSLGG